MTLEQLEEMLFFFYNDRDWYKYPDDLNKHFHPRFKKPEIQAMVQKLVKDGYLIEEEIPIVHNVYRIQLKDFNDLKELKIEDIQKEGEKVEERKELVHGWIISYDGIILIDTLPIEFKNKPYHYLTDIERKNKKLAAMESFPKRHWWVIPALSGIISFIVTGTTLLLRPNQPPSIISSPKTISNKTILNDATYDSSTKH